MTKARILIEGDSSILIVFGDTISVETNQRITATVKLIKEQRIEGIVDMIPAFVSLLINYNPLVISYDSLRKRLEKILKMETKSESSGLICKTLRITPGSPWRRSFRSTPPGII